MKLVIKKKYLAIPVNTNLPSKFLCFYEKDGDAERMVMDLECQIDMINPNFTAYVDVSRFIGKELEYRTIPYMDVTVEQYDERPLEDLYHEPYRPFVHFTTASGMINDPNGMIKYHGTYHMFYQYNPCTDATLYANMSWGHATSKDLIHWEDGDVALFPDETGTKYSGSGIEDVHNVSGLQRGDLPPMLLFYTAARDKGLMAGRKNRNQGLAYSVDGGKSFEIYANNPIIEHIEAWNRDPKVVWVEELNKFVLMLYMADDRFSLFTSDNMLDWEFLQQLSIEKEWECADLHSYMIDGIKYWVLTGANDIYVVGQFIDGKFVAQTAPRQLCPFKCSYAGQSISGMDDGRVVRVTCEQLNMPCKRTARQMSIPMEMKLKKIGDEFFLTATPAEELKLLWLSTQVFAPKSLETPFSVPLERAAYDIHIEGGFEGDMQIRLFGQILRVSESQNRITFGKAVIPLSYFKESKDIRIIVDSCSIELFVDGGKQFVALNAVCDYNLPYLEISSENGATVTSLTVTQLESIHK